MNRKLSHLTLAELRLLLKQADEQGHGKSVKQKLAWFIFANEHENNISLTCRHFAITRSTFLRWLSRFNPNDLTSLNDHSRRPDRVRLPETPPEVVELIRVYREKFRTMGKESIRKLLQQEHGIAISASTIGRVIQRHHFFFAEQPSHQLKLTAWAVSKQEDADAIVRSLEAQLPVQTSFDDLAANGGDDDAAATWFGPGLSAFFVAATIGASLLGFAPKSHAEESASFKITTEAPNMASDNVAASSSFTVDGGVTWYRPNAQSTSFQISDQGPASSSSSSSVATSSSSSAQSSTTISGGHGPGTPIIRPPEIFKRSSSSRSSSSSTIGTVHPSAPEMRGEDVRNFSAARRAMRLLKTQQPQRLTPKAKEELKRLRIGEQNTVIDQLNDRCWTNSCVGTQTLHAPENGFDLVAALIVMCIGAVAGWHFSGLWIGSNVLYRFQKPKRTLKKKRKTLKKKSVRGKKRTQTFIASLLITVLLLAGAKEVSAASVPQNLTYKGHLLNSSGAAITTTHNIRFSFWRSTDYVAGDVNGAGAVNTGAGNYAGWNEVQTVTPNSNGAFAVSLGSATALPDFATMSASDLQNLHLQVEVKASGAPDTSYELLDIDAANASLDRSQLLSVPFALNAGYVDQRKPGTGSGNLTFLDVNSLLSKGIIPGGTNQDFFTIDADNSVSAGSLALNFGASLGKVLSYDIGNSRFNFNDDVRIQGDLTVTGLINGINLNTLTNAASASLRVSSGAGLTVSVEGGAYRVNGNITNYAGASGIAVQNNTDNYVFFTSTGITVNTIGFPTDKSFIPLAKVTTVGGTVTAVTDRRVLQSDDREQTILQTLQPEFSGVAYKGDGSNNVGQLSQTVDETTQRNYYVWISTRPTIQDYDIVVTYTIPSGFTRWSDDLTVTYKSQTNDANDNKLDVQVFDTNGSAVTLSGSALNLTSTTWKSQHLEFTGSPTWTPGQKMLIRLKVSSKNNNEMDLGELKLQFVELKNP